MLIIVAYQRSSCERAENSAGGVKEWPLWVSTSLGLGNGYIQGSVIDRSCDDGTKYIRCSLFADKRIHVLSDETDKLSKPVSCLAYQVFGMQGL
jgi:hypothetical protein